MAHQSDMIAEDIHQYLKQQEEKSLLRFITCGSVDDGKSTLIGRLLWDSKLIFEDQLAALEADSKRVGTQGDAIDYALLLDGLQAEREQGITIDVAYRFFSTDKRKFIVADTPGHEQYTRNMVTGASTASVAVILVDARKGVLTQTRRHSYLVSLVGIKKVVLAVNKMDLVDYRQEVFEKITQDYAAFARQLGFEQIAAIPISALKGDNIIAPIGALSDKPEAVSGKEKETSDHNPPLDPNKSTYSLELTAYSSNMPWYDGPTLMTYLETVPVAKEDRGKPFRLPVQWVNRPDLDFRGFSGTIASGTIRPGDEIVVTASGKRSTVTRIVTLDGDLAEAVAGQAVTLTLADEIDISRGDLLAASQARPAHADQFEAKVVWMHEEPLLPGRSYLLKLGTSTVPAQVSALKYKVNVNTLEHQAGRTLALNEIGVCNFALGKALSFDPYDENPGTGGFILIDRFTNATVASGLIDAPLKATSGDDRSSRVIDRQARADLKGQTPVVLWFTGSSETDRFDLVDKVEKKLYGLGRHTYHLDGDKVGRAPNRESEKTAAGQLDRTRHTAAMARTLADAGLIVLVSVTTSFRSERRLVRDALGRQEFLEVFVDGSPSADRKRTLRNQGTHEDREISKVTGIDTAWEPPEIIIDGGDESARQLAERIDREYGW